MHIPLGRFWRVFLCGTFLFSLALHGQALGGAGTVQGKVVDPSGAVVPGATVEILNPVTGYQRTQTSDASGGFVFRNVPLNPYHVSVTAKGFNLAAQDVDVRSGVPLDLTMQLGIATSSTTVEVRTTAGNLLENDVSAHADVDAKVAARVPVETTGSGLRR